MMAQAKSDRLERYKSIVNYHLVLNSCYILSHPYNSSTLSINQTHMDDHFVNRKQDPKGHTQTRHKGTQDPRNQSNN